MRIPLYLAVAQWALLVALALLVVTAYRQLGRVLGRAAVPAELGPPLGSSPGPIAYQPLSAAAAGPAGRAPGAGAAPAADLAGAAGLATLEAMMQDATDAVRVFAPGQGQAALIAFVDPTCPACEQLVTALSAAEEAGELAGLRILLLVSDPPGYLQISAAFQACALDLGRPLDRPTWSPTARPGRRCWSRSTRTARSPTPAPRSAPRRRGPPSSPACTRPRPPRRCCR
jgi:hypothetical protein